MKKADIRPPNSALWPTRFSSLRKVLSAMMSETLVLSICAMIHRNSIAEATSSQRRVRSQLRLSVAFFSTAIKSFALPGGGLRLPQRPGALIAVLGAGLLGLFGLQI